MKPSQCFAQTPHKKSNFITTSVKIKALELKIRRREQELHANNASLMVNLKHNMTLPSSLLSAACLGYLLAEISQRQTVAISAKNDKAVAAPNPAWRHVVQLFSIVNSVYTTLPLIWMFKSWFDETKPMPPANASLPTTAKLPNSSNHNIGQINNS